MRSLKASACSSSKVTVLSFHCRGAERRKQSAKTEFASPNLDDNQLLITARTNPAEDHGQNVARTSLGNSIYMKQN